MNWKELQAPFKKSEVKTKQVSGRTEYYITARQVMNRLDAVCGPDGWYDVYQQIDAKHIECTLFIKCGEQFIGKTDVGEASNFAPMKGAYSDAFKRAAVRWGIGRELYQEGTVDWDDDAPAECPQERKTAPKTGDSAQGWADTNEAREQVYKTLSPIAKQYDTTPDKIMKALGVVNNSSEQKRLLMNEHANAGAFIEFVRAKLEAANS